MSLRAFVRAKDHIAGAKDWNDLKLTDSVKSYMEIEALVMKEEHDMIKQQLQG